MMPDPTDNLPTSALVARYIPFRVNLLRNDDPPEGLEAGRQNLRTDSV